MSQDGRGFAKRITLANLAEFLPLLRRAISRGEDRPDNDRGEPAVAADPAVAAAQAKFSGTPIRVRLPFRRAQPGATEGRAAQARRSAEGAPAAGAAAVAAVLPPTTAARGPEVWRKRLSATDAQRQEGHATGDLRLVMGAYRGRIDQTTYFRHSLFGEFTWTPERRDVETTQVQFDATILGERLGVHSLTISHKPSGEAGQKNYTTGLRWGHLAETLHAVDVTGRTIAIYAPVPGNKEPFFLEIS